MSRSPAVELGGCSGGGLELDRRRVGFVQRLGPDHDGGIDVEVMPAGVSLKRCSGTPARYGAACRLRNQFTVLQSPSSKSTGSMWGNKPRSRV